MPKLVFTIEPGEDLSAFRQAGKRAEQEFAKAFQGSGKRTKQIKGTTEAVKGQEEALKSLRQELRRRISLVDADLRLGAVSQEQAVEKIRLLKEEMQAQGAFNRSTLIGAQNLKTFANAQTRAENNFTGVSSVLNRANQVLFDFNQGLQDLPYGMRGVGNNIPFVIEGFRRFGKAAREEGISPIRAFLMALRSPTGLVGTAAAVIPTLVIFAQQWGIFGNKAEEASEKLDLLNQTLSETTNALPGVDQLDVLTRMGAELQKQDALLEERFKLQAAAVSSSSPWNDMWSEIDRVNAALEEQLPFLRDLNRAEIEDIRERVEELTKESEIREAINLLIESQLTEHEKVIRSMKDATDRVITNYNEKIGEDARAALQAHRKELTEMRSQLRQSIESQLAFMGTLDQTSEQYRTASKHLETLYERLKLVAGQADRTADALRRPDVPLQRMERPKDETIFDDRDMGVRYSARRFQQLEAQLDAQFRRMETSRRRFLLESEKMEMQMVHTILAEQFSLAERRKQIEQDLQLEIASIRNDALLSDLEKQQQIFDAQRQHLRDVLHFERQIAQQRAQVENDLQQSRRALNQETLNSLTSMSQAFARDNKQLAIGILAVEKALAIAQTVKEGAEKAGRAQMLASYYTAGAILNPAMAAAAINAQAQVAAIKRTTVATVAAIAATGLGEAVAISNRDSRTSGTSAGGAKGPTFRSGFVETEASSPTNFSASVDRPAVYVNLQTEADDRVISVKAERGRKKRERDMVTVNRSAIGVS